MSLANTLRIKSAVILVITVCTPTWPASYTNPVGYGILMGDPFVLQDGPRYYLYGTNTGDGFKTWTSTNLVQWDSVGYVYRKGPDTWGEAMFWAPEVTKYHGRYYLAYSARKDGLPPGSRSFRLCLAVADSPKGPFRDLLAPWFDVGWSTIDAHLFVDSDDKPYVYFARVGERDEAGVIMARIYGARLTTDLSRLEVGPVLCLSPNQPWEEPAGQRDTRCNEGAFVIRVGDKYFMTYSAHHYASPAYGIGWAKAPKPLGPWTKHPGNPLLATGMTPGVSGPGHNSITRSPDGSELFMVYHAHADPEHPSGRRTVNIDRIFICDGILSIKGPTRSEQPLPSGISRTPEAEKVLSYLKGLGNGRYMFGQMATWVHNENPDMDHPSNWLKKVYDHTGIMPRYGCLTYDFADDPFPDSAWNNGVKKMWDHGMIVGVFSFYANPSGGSWNGPVDIDPIFEAGDNPTKDNFYKQMDRMAGNLQWLKTRGIPVVYTPFVESDDRHKWHAKEGPEKIIKLYRLVHDYFTKDKGLDNIIWAYHTTSNHGALQKYYPGNAYVDVLGKSAYGTGLNFSEYDWALEKKKTAGKVIWWSELGIRGRSDPPRDCLDVLKKLETNYPELAGFVFWSDSGYYNVIGNINGPELMANPKIITLEIK